jgi:hypothetical protein
MGMSTQRMETYRSTLMMDYSPVEGLSFSFEPTGIVDM